MATPSAVARPADRYESTFIVSPDPSQGDFTNLAAALAALPSRGGKIFVKAGLYSISATIPVTASNVAIHGEGVGITIFEADATMTGNAPALQAQGTAVGMPSVLMADTVVGSTLVQVAATDAASFNPGDYVLLYSNKQVDTEAQTKYAGELKRIAKVSSAGGLTLDDQIFDLYTQAQAAHVVRVSMLQNLTLCDFSVTTKATSSALTVGFTHFRFIDNLQIQRVEVHDAFHSGIQMQSVLNAAISDCYVHHISDVTTQPNERYGVLVGGASQNITIHGCRFSHTRHSVTTGGSSGTYENGVQRNIVVSNCTSMQTDTAHFDTHQPAENVAFVGCVAIGGVPAIDEAYGFQMRARNCSIVGCSVLQAIGKGIMIFGPVSGGASVAGNMIAGVKAINGKDGTGIYFDSAGTSNHTVTGNVIKNCDGPAIANGGSSTFPNNDLVINGNIIQNTNKVVPGASIHLTNAERALISSNNFTGIGANAAISVNTASPVIVNNSGYNPVGVVSKPWPTSGGDLTNTVQNGSGSPASGAKYTVRQTPKTIVVAGGDTSTIKINDALTGLVAGVFKLGVGETIAISFGRSAPTTSVFAE